VGELFLVVANTGKAEHAPKGPFFSGAVFLVGANMGEAEQARVS